jgi:hypothetical protein
MRLSKDRTEQKTLSDLLHFALTRFLPYKVEMEYQVILRLNIETAEALAFCQSTEVQRILIGSMRWNKDIR